MLWRWYITIAAVRQWMNIAGLSGELEDTNPQFLAAQERLRQLSLEARAVGKTLHTGAEVYRSAGQVETRPGWKVRLQYLVMPAPRAEGALPQLVSVRTKPK